MGPIGVFDSGYGGLSVLRSLQKQLPQYDYLYLGDNARAPYGTRSFDTVYKFTLQAVKYLFGQGCPLIILACNTASAKALRTIQQQWLPASPFADSRVLGVIRPTAEAVAAIQTGGHIGIFGTPGTIASHSYDMEIGKLAPGYTVTGHACPMWVPIVEYGYADTPGADWFVQQEVDALMSADPDIDTVILGCTHYPLLYDKIRRAVPRSVRVLPQGDIVADSLSDYLRRHPEMAARLATGGDGSGQTRYLTTDRPERFEQTAAYFLGAPVRAQLVSLPA